MVPRAILKGFFKGMETGKASTLTIFMRSAPLWGSLIFRLIFCGIARPSSQSPGSLSFGEG